LSFDRYQVSSDVVNFLIGIRAEESAMACDGVMDLDLGLISVASEAAEISLWSPQTDVKVVDPF